MCIGILSKTQEQSNGVEAISIVLLLLWRVAGTIVCHARIVSINRPVFTTALVPEAFYGLFLEEEGLKMSISG